MEAWVEVNENVIIKVKFSASDLVVRDRFLDYKFTGGVSEIATFATTAGFSFLHVTTLDVNLAIWD
ncbi:MAG: hypothetical protein K8R35_06205 [Bacteroidales bacterium]|nr:hypothetical protein [Bacteroidales bacterium]